MLIWVLEGIHRKLNTILSLHKNTKKIDTPKNAWNKNYGRKHQDKLILNTHKLVFNKLSKGFIIM